MASKLPQADTFSLNVSRDSDGVVRLTVSGELDIYAAPRLREAIQGALAEPGTSDLTVDFANVDYIDCTGVSALITGRRLARERGTRFGVVNPHGQVLRVFTVLRLDHVLLSDLQHCA
ncbi:STAS domain-containing protein [Planosporangium flavigriseum]|uniref:STAS domain-containing protein n=1 Tax=Planosporangium flavigriseum TaxID=373681 RepID=UPI0014399A7C|nr:STAS domain-containing protein [Planosporangium flavigriseum]NJC67048.1 STAS domain-containing protein [Planosporangium flavigriseum]